MKNLYSGSNVVFPKINIILKFHIVGTVPCGSVSSSTIFLDFLLGSFFPFNSTFVQVTLSFSITTDKRSLKKLPGLSSSSSESSSISSRSWTPPKNRTLLVPGTPIQDIPLLGTGLAPICFTVCHFHLLKVSSCSEIIQIILVKLATLSYGQCLD